MYAVKIDTLEEWLQRINAFGMPISSRLQIACLKTPLARGGLHFAMREGFLA
jgi:hypothetical protein